MTANVSSILTAEKAKVGEKLFSSVFVFEIPWQQHDICPVQTKCDRARPSMAERFVESVRGIQKTRLCQIEDGQKVSIPDGHPAGIKWGRFRAPPSKIPFQGVLKV